MLEHSAVRARTRQAVALVAVLFGIASLAAGLSVLAGRDPGYVVYRPLVVFNTVMGVLYIVAGLMAWRQALAVRSVAAGIVVANLLVLAFIVVRARDGSAAFDSVRAMLLRSGVWLGILLVLWWTQSHRRAPSD